MVRIGMYLLKLLPLTWVDKIMVAACKLLYGKFSDHRLTMPTKGPFSAKIATGRSPVIDVGIMAKIKAGIVQVLPSTTNVEGDYIEFSNEEKKRFDAIVFARNFRTTVRKWLKDDANLFNEAGMPNRGVPNHWKGDNGIYCAGFSRQGLSGISNDATNISNDIKRIILALP